MNPWANILWETYFVILNFATAVFPNPVNENVKIVVNAPTQQNNVYQVTYVR